MSVKFFQRGANVVTISAASLVTSVQWKRVPLKMINAEEQVTEVITEIAEQIGFSDIKAKQREAILAFLSGKATFCFYSRFCFCFYVSDDESGSVVWLMLIS